MASTTVFLIMFVVFAAILVGAGIYSKRWVRETSDYILAGREVSTLINVMGVCAIGFAGTSIALAPGFTVMIGLGGSLAWGLIYCLCGLLLFGVIFANFIRRCGAQTLPEYLEMRYNSRVRSIVSITSVIGMCGILANNIVSCANTIVGFTGWPSSIVMAVIFLIIIAFTFISGLWAATITDFFQVCVGIVVIPLLLGLLAKRFGGFDAINANWPGGDFVSAGISGLSLPGAKLTYPSILNFIVCFAAALVWGNNYYWMKIASCRSEKIARRSFIIAAIVLIVVFMIPLALVGAYAGAFNTDAFILAGGNLIHTAAYGLIVKIFVPLLGSFFVIGAVAASVSTASTAAIGASAVATRDIYQRLINPKADAKKTLRMTKFIMVLVGVLTWLLCQFPGGPTYLFAFANCWLVPPAILVGLGVLWPGFNSRGAIWGALAGMISMFVLTLLGDVLGVFVINNYIYLATLGFIVTLVVAVIASLTAEPKYYGRSNWERVPNNVNREQVTLEDIDLKILELIRSGHLYMADLTDAMGVDSRTSEASIERLDRGGYIVRAGLRGSKFFTFEVTDKCNEVLPQPQGSDAEMLAIGLTPLYLKLLKILADRPEKQLEFVKENNIKSMHMAAICSHLTRKGYVVEKGLFKRRLDITDKGRATVKKFAAA